MSPVSTRAASVAAMLGVQLLGLVFVPATLGGLGLLAGAPLSVLVWPPTLALLLIVARLQANRAFPQAPWGAAFAVAAASILLSALALAGAAAILDSSWDGQAYHLEAVLALADGWNPVWGPPLRHHLIDFVPKSAWVTEALFSLVTGSPESAKAVHLLALGGAAALWYAAASAIGVRDRWALASAALIAANPIAVNQSLTFYVDGLVASSLAALLAVALLWWRTGDGVLLPVLGGGAAFLATLKFNGLALAALLAISLLVATRTRAPGRFNALLAAAAGGAALTVALGINPYVTNALRHGHPLHPFFGGREVPGVPFVFFRNAAFLAEPAPLRVLHSVAARASNDSEAMPRWKLPFAVDADELGAFTDADTRIGGWGPLFSGCVLSSIVVLVLSRGAPGAALVGSAQVLIWASILPMEQAFWARYAPQLWLAPALALFVGSQAPSRAARLASKVLALTLVLNVLLAGIPCLAARALRHLSERRQLAAMALASRSGPVEVRFGLFTSVRARLQAAGVSYRATDRLSCREPAEMVSSPVAYCLAARRSPETPGGPLDLLRPLLSR